MFSFINKLLGKAVKTAPPIPAYQPHPVLVATDSVDGRADLLHHRPPAPKRPPHAAVVGDDLIVRLQRRLEERDAEIKRRVAEIHATRTTDAVLLRAMTDEVVDLYHNPPHLKEQA
jgi:hypothetical protein